MIMTAGYLLGDIYLQPMTYEFQVGLGLTAGGGVVRNVVEKPVAVYRESQDSIGEGSGSARMEELPAYKP